MKTQKHDFARRIFLARASLLAAAVSGAVALQLLCSASETFLEPVAKNVGEWFRGSPSVGKFLVAAVLLGFASSAALRLRKFIPGARIRAFELAEHVQRPCVVLIVSSEDFRSGRDRLIESHDERGAITGWLLDDLPYLSIADLSTLGRAERIRLARDRVNTKFPWPWQQLLRALKPHEHQLKSVWLVGSRGENGSFRQLPKCRRLLQAVLGNDVKIFIEGKGLISDEFSDQMARDRSSEAVDFEDFDEISKRLDGLFRRIVSKPYSQPESGIVIDVTGGQKTTSIAAAALTLKSDVVFQYVQTGGEEVLIYDAVWVEKPSTDGE